ncbi:hypothetical protein Tco_0752481 [Tanacetum coccineum]|uniref:Copia protein n=1 Tax=Tanacetum coccineum TaxID=301880 RepID=A0ABQ4Z7Y5_9ASTR
MPMSTEIKLTKDDEADSVDSSKYKGDSVDRKSTSGVCTFMGCCLTSWFAKKQTALAISTTEAEYVSAGKACQQALWMKQALIDYDIRLDDILIMCDNKGAINLSICIYSDAWGLDELEKTLKQIEPYNSRLPALDDIRNLIHRRTVYEKIDKEGNTIHKLPNQIETNELFNHLRPCELVIRENVYSAIGNRDHTQAVIALMLYCLETRQPFNLAYFIIRRMYFFRDRKDKVLPYGMILTRLFRNLKANIAEHPFDERYKLVPRKMSPLKAIQLKKPPPKRTRNVGKSKRTQLSTSSSTESPPSDNGELPSTKFSPRSYSRALKDDPNMSKEQRETRDYFSASTKCSLLNLENSKDNIIPPVFSSFYNNPYLKDVQAFYAKELPISSPDPITSPAILTLSPVLPPSLLFDPRYFFVPEELLPPKKQIYFLFSSSTTLSNSSRNQTCDLVSPSFSVYTSTPPQVFEIGKYSNKRYLKHHEKQVKDILNYLDKLHLHRIEKMEEGRISGNKLKTELKGIRTQIIKLQKKQLGQKDKIAFAHYRISDLERIIEKIQARHQTDQEDL